MNPFLKSKIGLLSIAIFAVVMCAVFYRVLDKRKSRANATRSTPVRVANNSTVGTPNSAAPAAAAISTTTVPEHAAATQAVAENAAYLDQYYQLENRTRKDRDRLGNPITHRENASTPNDAARLALEDAATNSVPIPPRGSLRLQGRSTNQLRSDNPAAALKTALESLVNPVPAGKKGGPTAEAVPSTAGVQSSRPKRFNPYGSVIRCELVFTIDSTNEQTPLVGIVTDPVYNNGALVIPSGAELHGVARPDRLRDRIFSGEEWVLVLPREHDRPNGRQLTVKGVALDRLEPDANGATWGITDGSYGLEGTLIRTMQEEEIKRFAATFLAEAAQTLQGRQSDRGNHETIKSTPENAVLQGLSGNLQKLADDISAEIAQHGVFIRVPAGHQFYFYPMQPIDPDAADILPSVVIAK